MGKVVIILEDMPDGAVRIGCSGRAEPAGRVTDASSVADEVIGYLKKYFVFEEMKKNDADCKDNHDGRPA